jgi:CSLREA domain-containing protein
MPSLDSPRQPRSLPTRTTRAPRAKGARRLIVFLAALCFFAASASLFLYVRGRAAGTTYYSRGSSPTFLPESVLSWSTTRDGLGTSPTNFTNAGDAFVIQNTHSMTTVAGWTVSGANSKIEIESGGSLTATGAVTLSSTTSTFQIDGGGTYVHNNNSAYGSTIFHGTESFAATSTVILNNSNTTGPSGVAFGNLTINFTTDPGGPVNCSGGLTTVNGSLTVTSTSAQEFRFAANTSYTLGIGGDLILQGGTLNLASGTATPTINLAGNLTQTGGTLTHTGSNTSTFNFNGGSSPVTFNQTGGTLTDTQINWSIASGKTVQFGVNGASLAFTNAASRTFNINGTLLDAVQINNSGTMNVNGEFRLTDGGFATGNAFIYSGSATLAFVSSGSYGVGNDAFWPTSNGPANVNVLGAGVTLNNISRTVSNLFQTSAGVTLNSSTLTLNDTCQINDGGFFNNSPTYGSSSTLKYNISSSSPAYHRNGEWLPGASSGAGYPANVQLSNQTTLDLPNGSTSSTFQMSGSLTLDSGTTLDLGAMSQPLTVAGDLSLGGTLKLSTAVGGDFKLGGNWTRAAAGVFTPNARAVFFNGSGAQTVTVTGGGTEAFDYLVVDKSAGNLSPSSAVGNTTNISVTQTTGNVLQLVNAGGIDLNGQTFTLSGSGGSLLASGGARTVTGNGTFSFTGSKSVNGGANDSLTFDTGVAVNLSAGVDFGPGLSTLKGTLSIKPNGFVNTNPPAYASGSTLEYDNGTSFDAAAEFPASGVQNVRLASTTQLNLNSDKSIAGTFAANSRNVGTTAASPFSLAADTISVSTGTLNLNNVTTSTAFNASGAASVGVAGNWNVAGFSAGASTVNFDGAGAQTIQTASVFNNLTASNDLSLGASPNVGGVLALGSHKITTGANTLSIGDAGSVTRTSGYVLGSEQKSFNAGGSFTFDVGTVNGYSPVDANSTTGTGTLSAKPTQTKQPNISGANALSRYWTLTGTGISTNLTFHYLAGDVTSGTEANFKIFKYNGSTFTAFTPTTLDTTNHSATLDGVSSFSDWTLAESSAIFGQIQFAQANTNTLEGNSSSHTVDIAVQRTGGSSGAVSVDYSVTDGTATTANSDYSVSPASGTLNWADGDSADKTITITVNGDTTPEPDETVNLALSNAGGGATLGSPSSATLTITNDDPPTTVYVDDDWASLSPGTDPDGAGPATAIGFDAFSTIQAGVNAVAAGGTVNVAAGSYTENVTIGKAATLLGANANVAGSATRGAESNVRTVGNQTAVFSVSANNVTINGFNIDGDDPAVTGAALASGDDANVQYGVRPTGAFNHVTVRDNIIRRVFIGFRGDGASQNNLVTENWFDSIGNFDFGYAVSLRTNYYADITNNKMTRAWTGVHTNNFFAPGGPATWTLSGNEVHSYAGGLLYWLEYQNATGLTVNNNQFSAESGAVANNFGVLFVSIQDAVNPSFTNNTINGHNYGVGLFNVPTSNHITLGATNSVANSTLAGVLLTDNLNFNPVGTTNFLAGGPGAPSTVNVTGLAVNGNTGDGLKVEGTTNAQTLSVSGANVNGNSGTRGLEAVGAHAVASVSGSTFTGFATGVSLQNSGGGSLSVNAHFNRIVAATNAIDNPNNQTANLENNWWGCNAGPGGAGCGAVTGTGADFNPWLVLAVSASPNPITPGGTSNVTADLTHNSDAADTSAGGFIPATPVGFSATQGNVSPPSGTLTSGQATTTFTSTSSSSGTASATVDNQTVSTNVNVNAPAFSIDDVTASEGNSGTTDFTFHVTRSGATAFTTTVDYATADGTATGGTCGTAGVDYASKSGTLSFAPGDTSLDIVVKVCGDTAYENEETFTVNLSNAAGATIADGQGLGTIQNDDAQPTLSIDDVTHNEGDSGTTDFTFHVTRTGATALSVTVSYATADGTATAGSDYTATNGTLTFPASDTNDTQDITVSVKGDTTPEPDETFTVNLSGETNATVTKRVGTGTIQNDDADYEVTTGSSIVVTDIQGNGDTLTVSEPVAGQIKFAAPGRVFRVNGATYITGDSGNLSLSNVGQITVNQGGGDDTANVGAFTFPLPNLTVNGDAGDDAVNFNGSITFAADASLDANLQNDTATPGTDSVSVAAGAQLITSGAGTIDVRASRSVSVGGGLQTQNGDLIVEANQQASATVGDFNGVDILGGTIQSTGTGGVSVKGTGGTGGTGTHGVNVRDGGAVTSKDGDINVTGTGGDGANNAGINLANTGTAKLQTTGTGSINLIADRMTFDTANATIDAGTNSVTLRQKTAGTPIDLGSTTDAAAGTLELSDGELDRVTAGTLNVGDAASGTITVSASITRPAPTVFNLTSGGSIDINASSLDSGGGNVTLTPGSTGSVNPAASGADVSMGASGTLSFSSGADLPVAINGTTADTQYTQLNVVGKVDLTGVDLVISGSDTVAAGQQFVIVNNDGADAINGTFNGLPEGSTIPNFLSSGFDATITYAGGDGNDCVITVKPLPTFSINDKSVSEGDSGQTDLTFTITKTGSLSQSVSVVVDTADGTATAPSDYTAITSQLVTFPSGGDATQDVTVKVNGDTHYEHDETLFVNLSNPTRATIDDGQGLGTILNDDAKPTLSITSSVALFEGNSGTTAFTFHVTKSGATDVDATVQYATANGTAATANNDYQPNAGSLTFLPGDTDKTITVFVNGDTTYEADETFTVNLSNAVDADITSAQGVGTIKNDDKPGVILTVNTTDDIDNGACLRAHCSLREAINAANFNADSNLVFFGIPAGDPNRDATTGVFTISPTSALPAINSPVTIDGYTQTPCSSNTAPCSQANTLAAGDDAVLLVELNGSNAGISAAGLSVGGGATVRGLVINRFGGPGINFSGSGNTVAGNFIGTNAAGTSARANGGSGVFSNDQFGNLVGGSTADARNLISGNTGDGVTFAGGNSNSVQGNFIGTKADGTSALGNGANGVAFSAGSVFNSVGGTNAGEGNTIAFNVGDGVHIDSTVGVGHGVRANSIHDNGTTANDLGIDLGTDGVTPNDDQDADTGPNNLQNFPVITSALVTGSTRTITGTLNSTPSKAFAIDFFASPSCDASGNGEGQTYLGSLTTSNTDANGDVSFTFHPTSLSLGQFVTATATATDPSVFGSTSEFSQCFAVAGGTPGAVEFSQSSYNVAESGGVAHITIKRVGGSDGSISATFSTSDGTATTADNDYAGVLGTTVTFNDGDTADKTVDVTINDDSIYETDETVNLSLSSTTVNTPALRNGPLAPVGGTSATLTITNDDAPPTFSINDVTHNEGNSGTTDFTFTVTRAGNPTEVTATVNFATQDGAAVAPGDYQSNSGTLTFLPADATKTFTVLVNGDTTEEPDEDFTVHLSSPSAATISDADGTGTIKNDDNAPSFSVNDQAHAEGNSGTVDFTFTVTKTGATAFATSVDFATQDGTATIADGDYQSNSGTLNFAAAETTKTFTVHVNGDTKPEVDETFNVILSNPLGATVGDGTGAGTIQNDDESVAAGQLIISEFRLRGPGATPTPSDRPTSASAQTDGATSGGATTAGSTTTSAGAATAAGTKKHASVSFAPPSSVAVDTSPQANDEFVELYNNTDSPLLVTTTDGSKGWALTASDGVVRFIIPDGTVIPARAHFLGVNKLGYSLSAYPAGNDGSTTTTATGDPILLNDGTPDNGYTLDIPDNAGIAVFRTATPGSFSTTTRLDAAGSTSEANTLYKEGAGYPALSPSDIAQNLESSFYRNLCGLQPGVGCTTQGLPTDTDNNASDFLFVDTKGTPTAAGQRLGAPGPENLSSHIARDNAHMPAFVLDRSKDSTVSPNRFRDPTSNTPNATVAPFGTLSLRRRFTNNTGAPVVQLRFRIIEMTTFPAPAGVADLRAISSTQVSVSNVGDTDTCGGSAPCTATVEGTTVDEPPTQLSTTGGTNNGGGYNTSLSVGTIDLAHPLAQGASVNVQFLLGVRQTGNFRIFVNVEAVNASTP